MQFRARREPMRRRDFITLLGGAAAGWPLAARAQQSDRMRRIGVLIAADNPEFQGRIATFRQSLKELGWTDGHNVRIDYRWGAGSVDLYRRYATELVASTPDVILASGGLVLAPLREATRTVPIVFTQANDPVALGYVASLARPGGNMTGFSNIEYRFSGKWLELLKQIAPRVARAAVLRDSEVSSGIAQFGAMQAAARSLGMELSSVDVTDAGEIERSIAAFAREANGGLVVTASTVAATRRNLIIDLAARHRLPAVYPARFYVVDGGLISYGPVITDQYRRAAGYVDRILKGEKPANLPVQAPSRYELAINRETAKSLGIEVPRILLAVADELIN
jgi:putative tryptophan/tyrosine transport system substrate-binding protein